MLGFTFAWQETQAPPAPEGFAAGLAVAGFVAAGLVDGAAGFFWAVAGAARTASAAASMMRAFIDMRPPRWGSPPTVGWRVLLGGGVDAATAG
jgi:hypothetical protein